MNERKRYGQRVRESKKGERLRAIKEESERRQDRQINREIEKTRR